MTKIRRAVISVYDKKGIAKLAKGLGELGVEMLSTGGTAKRLRDGGAKVTEISDYTGLPGNTRRKGENASSENPRGPSQNKGR